MSPPFDKQASDDKHGQSDQGLDVAVPPESLDELSVALYEALRERARKFSQGRLSVDPTDLVHDAYVRLARSGKYGSMGRSEFLALTATVVRRLLIDAARRNQRRKDFSHQVELTVSDAGKITPGKELDLLALDEAMRKLCRVDPIQSRIVELRFFAGLDSEEVGHLMGLDRRAVTREWGMARAWLKRELER
jgi:RNA polymerase sigma-70 factor (ECF subfamily)